MRVLVIVANGLRCDALGCYGNDWIDTPHLDQLAADGVVFDWHYADRPDQRTMWSGRYRLPPLTGADEPAPPQLGPLLQAHGVRWSTSTDLAAVTPAALPHNSLLWLEMPDLLPPWQVPVEFLDRYLADDAQDDEETEDSAASAGLTPWLDPPAGPFDTHDAIGWRRLHRSYAAAVSHLDRKLGTLFDSLQEQGLYDQLLVVITAERGLALGEHGIVGDYRPWLHEELVHLPLLVKLPGGEEAGRRVGALTQPIDLLPTLLAAFGLAAAQAQGHSLWPLARGQVETIRDHAFTGMRQGERVEWAIRTQHWALLLPVRQEVDDPLRPPQLYVRPEDRWQVNDLRVRQLELAEELEARLRAAAS